jgi:hypothetical protein
VQTQTLTSAIVERVIVRVLEICTMPVKGAIVSVQVRFAMGSVSTQPKIMTIVGLATISASAVDTAVYSSIIVWIRSVCRFLEYWL